MISRIQTVVALAALCAAAAAQNGDSLARLPAGKTSAAALASSADGLSRYLAPDGPIQPAIAAIGTLPARASEQINRGITRLSAGLDEQAQGLSRAAGQDGQIRMPGMDTAETHMPESIARMGQSMQDMIRRKNQFIMSQAEQGVEATNRLGQMMRAGPQRRSGGGGGGGGGGRNMMGAMMSQTQDFMQKSATNLQEHVKEHLEGAMGRMGTMQGMGQHMMDQAQGIGRTLHSGVEGVVGQIQQTGQELMGQLQGNHHHNMQSMSGVLGSFQGSMGKMGSNMQKGMDGLMHHVQEHAQNLGGELMHHVQEHTQHLGGGLMHHVQEHAQNLGGELMHHVQEHTQHLGGGLMHHVQEHAQNLGGELMHHVQEHTQHLTSGLGRAVEAPMKVLSSLTNSLGSMMSMTGGSSKGGRGRGY